MEKLQMGCFKKVRKFTETVTVKLTHLFTHRTDFREVTFIHQQTVAFERPNFILRNAKSDCAL